MVIRRGFDKTVNVNEKLGTKTKTTTTVVMGPERSKRLHNFTLPTPELTWRNQKFLRCTKTNGASSAVAVADTSASGPDREHRRSSLAADAAGDGEIDVRIVSGGGAGKRNRRHFDYEFDDSNNNNQRSYSIRREQQVNVKHNIEAIREKLMFDLKTAADSMKFTILNVGDDDNRGDDKKFEKEERSPAKVAAAAVTEERPWNLRTRRAVYNASIKTTTTTTTNEKNSVKIDDKKMSNSPERIDNSIMKPSRLRDGGGHGGGSGENKERAKFCVPLSKKEIAEDYLAMIGGKPPRRPKKRSKTIQKQLDSFFPGLWLTEVTPDMYTVDETPESGKR